MPKQPDKAIDKAVYVPIYKKVDAAVEGVMKAWLKKNRPSLTYNRDMIPVKLGLSDYDKWFPFVEEIVNIICKSYPSPSLQAKVRQITIDTMSKTLSETISVLAGIAYDDNPKPKTLVAKAKSMLRIG